MEGQLGEILSKLSSYNESKPIQNDGKNLDTKEKPSKEKKGTFKKIIFNGGFAIATALSLNFTDYLPANASSGLSGYEVNEVGYQINEDQELPQGVLTATEYVEDLPANYFGSAFSSIESQAMGSILPEELIYNLPGQRNREAWKELINHLDPESNPRYSPREGKTYCNFFARDALREFGVPIPVTYIDPKTGEVKPTLANNIHDRLLIGSFTTDNPQGTEKEWIMLDEKTATAMANAGYPVIVSVKNNTGGSGHIALLAPEGIVEPNKTPWNSQDAGEGASGTLIVAQAGGRNGILKWNDEHYSEENNYSERRIFVHANDHQFFQQKETNSIQNQKVEFEIQDDINVENYSRLPPLFIEPQVLPNKR